MSPTMLRATFQDPLNEFALDGPRALPGHYEHQLAVCEICDTWR